MLLRLLIHFPKVADGEADGKTETPAEAGGLERRKKQAEERRKQRKEKKATEKERGGSQPVLDPPQSSPDTGGSSARGWCLLGAWPPA